MHIPVLSKIQRFSPDDGPGVRTTFFFKGCSLSCAWCHNPECISPAAALVFREEDCIGCGLCREVCPTHAREGRPLACTLCGACVRACPAGALVTEQTRLTPEEVVAEAWKDKAYYGREGGLTLSGGEPLLYPDYLADICRLAGEQNLPVAIDTALHVPWEHIEKLLPFRPLFLADVKAADPDVHARWTGQDNTLILDNLTKLAAGGADYWVSIPLVPGANEKEIPAIARILQNLPKPPQKIRLLPYHTMGLAKGKGRDLPPQQAFAPPDAGMMEACRRILGIESE